MNKLKTYLKEKSALSVACHLVGFCSSAIFDGKLLCLFQFPLHLDCWKCSIKAVSLIRPEPVPVTGSKISNASFSGGCFPSPFNILSKN